VSVGGETVTWVITATTVSVTAAGIIAGTGDWSVEAIDEGARHIRMSQTSASGVYDLYPNQTTWYMTYRVSGNSLYLLCDVTTYPSTATAGPYTRQ
jgi:hypothetical protein